MKRGLLVYNPTAGQRDRRGEMSALIDRQRRRGPRARQRPDERSGRRDGDRPDVSCRAASTSSRSAAATARSRRPPAGLEGSTVPLAVLPGGTSNVLAIELGIPLDLAPRPRPLLMDGVPHALRLAHADGRPFLLWAGAGLDARVMGNMRLAWKRCFGRARNLPTALSEFLQYEFPRPRGRRSTARSTRPRSPWPAARSTTPGSGSSRRRRASTPTTSKSCSSRTAAGASSRPSSSCMAAGRAGT